MTMPRRIIGVVALCIMLCFMVDCSRKSKGVSSQRPREAKREVSEQVKTAYKNKITFTVAEVAELLKCDEGAVIEAIREGKLKAAKIGNDYRISRPDLETFWLAQGGGKLF